MDLILDEYKPNKEKIINTSHQYYSLEQGVKRYKEVYLEIFKSTYVNIIIKTLTSNGDENSRNMGVTSFKESSPF